MVRKRSQAPELTDNFLVRKWIYIKHLNTICNPTKHSPCSWALLLKLHLATFSHWERSFWASLASNSHNLLSWTKHRIGVLRSSKEVILCNQAQKWLFLLTSSNSWKFVSALQKTVNFSRKKTFSCSWALLLKLH